MWPRLLHASDELSGAAFLAPRKDMPCEDFGRFAPILLPRLTATTTGSIGDATGAPGGSATKDPPGGADAASVCLTEPRSEAALQAPGSMVSLPSAPTGSELRTLLTATTATTAAAAAAASAGEVRPLGKPKNDDSDVCLTFAVLACGSSFIARPAGAKPARALCKGGWAREKVMGEGPAERLPRVPGLGLLETRPRDLPAAAACRSSSSRGTRLARLGPHTNKQGCKMLLRVSQLERRGKHKARM